MRTCLALLFAALLAVPSASSEGGENAGGTGVWILPACVSIGSGVLESTSAPRATFTAPDTNSDLRLKVSNAMGQSTAVAYDELSGQPVPCPVIGCIVTVPATLLQALRGSARPNAAMLISDGNQLGYVVHIRVRADGSVLVDVD